MASGRGRRLRDALRVAVSVDPDSILNGVAIAIDPGPRVSYYAKFDAGELVETGKWDHRKKTGTDYLPEGASVVLVETPVGWPVRTADGGMSLLETAVRVGEFICDASRVGATGIMVGSTAWRATLFGITNPTDKAVRGYVESAVDMPNRNMRLNNVHVRDAIGVYLAAAVVAKEGRLL